MDIRVLRFWTKINHAGKAVDWVEYAPAHAISSSTNVARVNDMIPPVEIDQDRDPAGTKLFHMKAVWSFIEPHYKAWKSGKDMPETGLPLSSWPGIGEAEIFELNRVGIKSVEDVAGMSEGALDKVALPNPREIRKQAQLFLKAREAQESAHVIEDLQERLAAAEAVIAESQAKPKRGRPRKDEAA